MFAVSDMTCGHCVSTITKAVHAVDKDAEAEFDLAQHLVKIQPRASGEQELSDAIKEAGYTPVPASAAATTGTAAKQGVLLPLTAGRCTIAGIRLEPT